MYAQVVVLTYQALDIDSFTYKVPKELEKEIKVGQLVEVPFGKRNPQGIVIAISHSPFAVGSKVSDFGFRISDLKQISKILIKEPLMFPYQINLLLWMSSYYLAPMVNCLGTMLPEIPKKAVKSSAKLKGRPFTNETASPRPALSTGQPSLRADLGSGSNRKKVSLSTRQQSLVLVPSINRIAETLAKFPKAKNYVVYHNELKASEKFAAWMKILSGQADYIFGSRSAIFTPCPNLQELIIYDEHDGAYKDERSPYFDTLSVAQQISQLTRAQLKFVDPSPKITTYFALPNHIKIQNFPQKTEIINMQNEKLSGKHSAISFDLEEAITNIIEKNGNVLLFLNRIKESGHFFCKSCKTSGHLESEPQACPNCQSPDIFWNVLNINSLATEVKKLFPKTTVNLIFNDKQKAINDQQLTIDIGTAYTLYSTLFKKYDLVAHIQTDSLLNLADYTSGEKLFAQIISLKKILKENGKLILQTYNAENSTINLASSGNYQSFFKEELKARKLLLYPPFGLLVKLTIKDKSDDKAKKEAESTAANLRSAINDSQSTILGPYKSVFWQKTPAYHIILKIKIAGYSLQERSNAISALGTHLEKGGKKYTIEVDPQTIQ